jgi:hypothetical protein
MARAVMSRPDWLGAAGVDDILSVSGCMSAYFADYIPFWRHNGYWLFDSPDVIREVARENNIDMAGMRIFYYEVHPEEFDDTAKSWRIFKPEDFETQVIPPPVKNPEGFDVTSFSAGSAPECSPLSCNGLAGALGANRHCLFDSFDAAKQALEEGGFANCEPGPYRVFSVYSLPE